LAVIGTDIGNDIVHMVGFDIDGKLAFRRKTKRQALGDTFRKLPSCDFPAAAGLGGIATHRLTRHYSDGKQFLPGYFGFLEN
jgi:hypothetical protein